MNQMLWQLIIMMRNCLAIWNYWMIYGGYCTGGIGYLIEMKEHTYRDLTLELLSTLHVKVTRGSMSSETYFILFARAIL